MMIKYLKYQFPWQLLMLGLFIQSSISSIELPDLVFNWFDKILHFLVFGSLGLLMARGFQHSEYHFFNRNYITAGIVLATLYGAFDEIHQSFVPGRMAEISDFVADFLGILFFIWIYYVWQRSTQSKMKKRAKTGR